MIFKKNIMNKEINYLSYNEALLTQKKGQGIIIDVREPAEFRDGHLIDAINLNST